MPTAHLVVDATATVMPIRKGIWMMMIDGMTVRMSIWRMVGGVVMLMDVALRTDVTVAIDVGARS